MNAFRALCMVAFVAAAALAAPNQSSGMSGKLKPSQWLSSTELEQVPALDEVSSQRLESMPLERGANLLQKIYHVSQINHNLRPTTTINANKIPVHIVKSNGQKESTSLDKLAQEASRDQTFGDQEVTIFITGLPSSSEAVKKANRHLIQAYMARYNMIKENPMRSDSEETTGSKWQYSSNDMDQNTGNLVIIDLASALPNFESYVTLDVERTGAAIGKEIVKLTQKSDVPSEIINIVAQNIGAHVAGAAANEFSRLTGNKLRSIVALDPSKVFAKQPNELTGLSRGDAQFVSAIHTSALGMGTLQRVGDVDFYPNGPSAGVPGANNVIKASALATDYFAESVVPGNEHNFPAIPAKSLKQYKNNNGYGPRAYMGISTDFDVEGDYILEVNPQSPFGQRTPVQKQNTYHGTHKKWNKSQDNE